MTAQMAPKARRELPSPYLQGPITGIQALLRHRLVQYFIAPLLFVAFFFPLSIVFVERYSVSGFSDVVSTLVQNGITFCIMAVGAALVISTAQIDLSAVGVAVMSGVVFSLILSYGPKHPDALWIGLAIFGVLALAVSSGLLVSYCFTALHVPLLIFTWALGSIYVIVSTLLTRFVGPSSSADVSSVDLPWRLAQDFWTVGQLGFTASIMFILLTLLLIEGINLRRRAAALGANEVSAEYAGISRRRTYVECFVANAILSGFAGIFHTLFLNSASSGDLPGRELIPIAIAVLGGTSLAGGYLSFYSVIAAALFWEEANMLGPALPHWFPWLQEFEAELGQILFYTIFFIVSLAFGPLLSPRFSKNFSVREIAR